MQAQQNVAAITTSLTQDMLRKEQLSRELADCQKLIDAKINLLAGVDIGKQVAAELAPKVAEVPVVDEVAAGS